MIEAVQDVAAVVETLKSEEEIQSMASEINEVNNIVVYLYNGLRNLDDEFVKQCVAIKIAMIDPNKFKKLHPIVEQIKENAQQLMQGQANLNELRNWLESVLDDIEEAEFVMAGIASNI